MQIGKTLVAILITVLLSELLLRIHHRDWALSRDGSTKPQSSRFYDFEKISKIEPHLECNYLTKEFWHEMQSLTKDRSGIKMTNNSGDRYLVAKNCTGEFFSVSDNLRTTLFAPSFSQHNYYLFGSSTLHNFEVPDSMTTASNLQKLFSTYGYDLSVRNYGVSGATIENNFARMLAIENVFKQGDIIVILFGINDVGLDTYPQYEMNILKIVRRLGEFSLVMRTIHRQLARNSWQNHSKNTARHKTRLLEEINTWADSSHIKFQVILEPVHHLKQNPNNYELELRKTFGQKLEILYKFGYREFTYLLNPEFAASTINVFNETKTSVFLDQAHINSVGTEILAAEIFKLTTPGL